MYAARDEGVVPVAAENGMKGPPLTFTFRGGACCL
jgi:hypothetical protein